MKPRIRGWDASTRFNEVTSAPNPCTCRTAFKIRNSFNLVHSNYLSYEMDTEGLRLALEQAKKSYDEGGIPIGSVLLISDTNTPNSFKVLGSGHNERIQKGSPILHGEMAALENAGRLKADVYRRATIVKSTVHPY